MAWIPGIEELGSGYDYLNGQYAQNESCTENLFDWSNIPTHERKHNGQTYIIPNIVNVSKNAKEKLIISNVHYSKLHFFSIRISFIQR